MRQHPISNDHVPVYERGVQGSECREALRDRFHKVILGAGYSETAAQQILERHFEEYLQDRSNFIKMLEEYESKMR